MRKYLVAASLLLVSVTSYAQTQSQSPVGGGGNFPLARPAFVPRHAEPPFLKGDEILSQTWDPTIAAYGNNPDGMAVRCFAEDSDNLYLGGDFITFDTVPASFIVRYNRKTGAWSWLDTGLDNDVYALAVHDGKLYAAGTFYGTYSGGTILNNIAEWNGSSWQNIGGGMNGNVNALAFVGDTLYAGGNFTEAGGIPAHFLAYWDGLSWHEAFGGTSGTVQGLMASNDSLFVGGIFYYAGGHSFQHGTVVAGSALLKSGTWNSMGNGFWAATFALFHDTLWGGGYYFSDGQYSKLVYNLGYWDGTEWQAVVRDTNTGTNGTGNVNQLLTVGDTLLALGSFSSIGGASANGIAMYHNGNWSQLAGGLYGSANAAIPFDGKLYVGGEFTKAGNISAMGIASLKNGNWTSLANLAYQNVGWETDEVSTIATTSRYVFIGGSFETIAGIVCNHIAAYDKQQHTWITLGPGVDGDVYKLMVMGNTLVVCGDFNHAGEVGARHIARYDIATRVWSGMGTGAVRNPDALATDGTSVYATIFNPLAGKTFYDVLGRWDGTKWTAFGNGLTSGYIRSLVWRDSTLYAAGYFYRTDDGTILSSGVAQIQPGGSWFSLNSGINGTAYALALSGDSLYVGGDFTLADGQVDSALAVWNPAKQSWNPIGAAGFDGPVLALAADGAGGVYAGGNFSEVAQASRGNLVHWNGSKFGTVGAGVNNEVDALGIDDLALYAGGWFWQAGNTGTVSLHFAALDGAGAGVNSRIQGNSASLSIFPDPASAASTVSFELAKPAEVRIELFNAIGSRVALLADSYYNIGRSSISFDASKLSNGMYFLRLTSRGVVASRSFVVEQK